MFTGWFYVCAGEVISWFLIWEQGVESSNLSVPTSKTPVQRLILEINKSRFWGSIRLGTVWGQLRKEDERFFEAISEHWGILGGILNHFSC